MARSVHLAIASTLVGPVLAASVAGAASPWLPLPGHGEVSVSHTRDSFDEFYQGTEKTRGPGATDPGIEQVTTTLHADYGLRPRLAIDLAFGHTRTSFADLDDLSGLSDVRVGLRYQLMGELAFAFDEDDSPVSPPPFTLAARIGAVVSGTYDVVTDAPHSPGDGASGAELSLLAGKVWGHPHVVWTSGELGYAFRTDGVPDDVVAAMSVGWRHAAGVAFSGGLRHVQALSGSDFGDPGFVFQELREVVTAIELDASWSSTSGPFAGVGLARTVAGRNTGDELVIRASMGTAF